jgi:hypothetical protein
VLANTSSIISLESPKGAVGSAQELCFNFPSLWSDIESLETKMGGAVSTLPQAYIEGKLVDTRVLVLPATSAMPSSPWSVGTGGIFGLMKSPNSQTDLEGNANFLMVTKSGQSYTKELTIPLTREPSYLQRGWLEKCRWSQSQRISSWKNTRTP